MLPSVSVTSDPAERASAAMTHALPREKLLILFDVDGTLTDPRLVRRLLGWRCHVTSLTAPVARIRADAPLPEGAAQAV